MLENGIMIATVIDLNPDQLPAFPVQGTAILVRDGDAVLVQSYGRMRLGRIAPTDAAAVIAEIEKHVRRRGTHRPFAAAFYVPEGGPAKVAKVYFDTMSRAERHARLAAKGRES